MEPLAWVAAALIASSPSPPPPEPGAPKPQQAQKKSYGLQPPVDFPQLARGALHARMQRHGKDMSVLVNAVVLLNRSVIRELATDIADEPRLTRPTPDAMDALNAALPERFFVLQDELRVHAKALAEAATSADDDALAKSFGRMTQTCVTCHATFQAGAPKAAGP
jgi:hypothetical protein